MADDERMVRRSRTSSRPTGVRSGQWPAVEHPRSDWCWALLAALATSACAPDREVGAFPAQAPGLAGDGGGDAAAFETGEHGHGPLEGEWVFLAQTSTCVSVMTAVVENLAWSWAVIDVEETGRSLDGSDVWMRVKLRNCFKDLSPVVMGLAAIVPPEMLQALPETQFECVAHLADDPGRSGTEGGDTAGRGMGPERGFAGATVECGPHVETWGVTLADPEDDPMPASADDPHVIDEDDDGKPGVTLKLGEDICEMYVVQRSISFYSGELVAADFLAGTFHGPFQQVVLDGSEPLCVSENETADNPVHNRIYWFRADGFGSSTNLDANGDGTVSCGELDAGREELAAAHGAVTDKPDSESCKQGSL